MILNQLKGHEKATLERRGGVHHSVRCLLRRAGIDILDPGEDCHITSVEREIPMQDGTTFKMVFNTIDQLYWPVTSYGHAKIV